MMDYTTVKFIEETLKSLLKEERSKLGNMMRDKDCSMEIYENTLDNCKKLEYSIEQLEKMI